MLKYPFAYITILILKGGEQLKQKQKPTYVEYERHSRERWAKGAIGFVQDGYLFRFTRIGHLQKSEGLILLPVHQTEVLGRIRTRFFRNFREIEKDLQDRPIGEEQAQDVKEGGYNLRRKALTKELRHGHRLYAAVATGGPGRVAFAYREHQYMMHGPNNFFQTDSPPPQIETHTVRLEFRFLNHAKDGFSALVGPDLAYFLIDPKDTNFSGKIDLSTKSYPLFLRRVQNQSGGKYAAREAGYRAPGSFNDFYAANLRTPD
jgi:hypothetical protein